VPFFCRSPFWCFGGGHGSHGWHGDRSVFFFPSLFQKASLTTCPAPKKMCLRGNHHDYRVPANSLTQVVSFFPVRRPSSPRTTTLKKLRRVAKLSFGVAVSARLAANRPFYDPLTCARLKDVLSVASLCLYRLLAGRWCCPLRRKALDKFEFLEDKHLFLYCRSEEPFSSDV